MRQRRAAGSILARRGCEGKKEFRRFPVSGEGGANQAKELSFPLLSAVEKRPFRPLRRFKQSFEHQFFSFCLLPSLFEDWKIPASSIEIKWRPNKTQSIFSPKPQQNAKYWGLDALNCPRFFLKKRQNPSSASIHQTAPLLMGFLYYQAAANDPPSVRLAA